MLIKLIVAVKSGQSNYNIIKSINSIIFLFMKGIIRYSYFKRIFYVDITQYKQKLLHISFDIWLTKNQVSLFNACVDSRITMSQSMTLAEFFPPTG